MARVGKIPDSQMEIHIEGTEGNIPHFHLQKKNGKPENCVCHIKLLEPEYLQDKDDPMNILSSKERKALNDYMHRHIALSESTNWKYCIDTWNIWNSSHPIDITKY